MWATPGDITAFWMHPARSWRRAGAPTFQKGFADLCQQSAILEQSRRPAKDRGEARAQGGTPKVLRCRGSLCPRHPLWNWRNNHAVLRESTWYGATRQGYDWGTTRHRLHHD